jgi:excinuclease ABC subunit B
MYADVVTESMRQTIDETNRRRSIQMQYNEEHHITPAALNKSRQGSILAAQTTDSEKKENK